MRHDPHRSRVVAQRRWGWRGQKVKKTHWQPARSSDLRVKVVRLHALRRRAHRAQVPIEVASPVVRSAGNHHKDLAKNAHATGTRTNEYGVGLGLSVLRSKWKKYGKQKTHLCNVNAACFDSIGTVNAVGRAGRAHSFVGSGLKVGESQDTRVHLAKIGRCRYIVAKTGLGNVRADY
ncbi:hypothetical protein C8R44DRAFT_747380 [Mycena epipterygia]|nr:hypothetical protein C8R44DRAFT_747380 [Mycena epipterygia]